MAKPRISRARALEDRGQIGLGFSAEEMTWFPGSDWGPPDLSSLPDRLHGVIGVDTETEDRGLAADIGPGWAWRGGGHVAGYSVAADNFCGYFPVGHAEGNVDGDAVRRWLNCVLGDERQLKVFANAMYDTSWAAVDGVKICGPCRDVQLVEALVDEHRREYALDAIALDRLGRGKDEAMLREAARAYGVDPKKDLWRMHPRFVGPYAEEDARIPRELWALQEPLVAAEELGQVVELEHALLPMYVDMRRRGVRVDAAYAERLRDELAGQVAALVAEVRRLTGHEVAIWESRSVARLLDAEGVPYGRTEKRGEPQITNDVLEDGTAVTKLVACAREKDKLRGTFLEGQVLGQLHDGRVHGNIHPLKSDDGGTVTGRLSMSSPNLQFIPKRTVEGKKIRRAFVPEDGELWASPDFSQQEVRLLVHYGVLSKMKSARDARDHYVADPGLNFHKFVAELTGLDYDPAKILDLAIIYGRGIKETAIELGKSYDETKALFDQHEEKMPFAKSMSRLTQSIVQERGYLMCLLGRRVRFPFFEPADWDHRDGRMLRWDDARRAWPNQRLTRARLHKALNSLIQPSAASQTKKAMLDVWRAGFGGHVMIQVHDELPSSVPDRKTAEQIAEVMQQSVELEVPVKVDLKVGKNWGEIA